MSEVLKDFSANIDLKQSLVNEDVKVVEGDNGNVLVLNIVKDGEPVDLTDCLVQIVFAHSGRTVWQDSSSPDGGITISGDDNNIVTVRLHSDSYAPNGITVCQVKVYSGPTQTTLVSSSRFSFKAELSLLNAETVESIEQYSILVTMIETVNGMLDRDQADWDETDTLKVSFIKNKPVVNVDFAAAAHASRHLIGGADALNAMPYDAASTNLLINGGFDVWQRGTSFSASGYSADRWTLACNGSGATMAITQQAFTLGQTDVSENPQYYLRYNQSVAGSGGTYNILQQRVENVLLLSGKTVTLSFYAKAAAATSVYTYANQNFGSGGSSDVGVMGATISVGTSWVKYTQTFEMPSVSGKTVGANSYTYFGFVMPNNATFTFNIAQVQLNYGAVALPFVPRPFADELRLCQRYYLPNVARGASGYAAGTIAYITIRLPEGMRAKPTPTLIVADFLIVGAATVAVSSIATIERINDSMYSLTLNLVSSVGANTACSIANTTINLDSEL